jgi:GNAT superfamily N-acetyltransferase
MAKSKVKYQSFNTEDHPYDLNVHSVEDFHDKEVFRIIAKDSNGEEIGRADFAFHSDLSAVVCWKVFVEDEYRRQGIATKMYDLASEFFGEPIQPFPGGHSKDAHGLWRSRHK